MISVSEKGVKKNTITVLDGCCFETGVVPDSTVRGWEENPNSGRL